jgi:hypothetical protein
MTKRLQNRNEPENSPSDYDGVEEEIQNEVDFDGGIIMRPSNKVIVANGTGGFGEAITSDVALQKEKETKNAEKAKQIQLNKTNVKSRVRKTK